MSESNTITTVPGNFIYPLGIYMYMHVCLF